MNRLQSYSSRIEAAVSRGLCYCDSEHLCGVHSTAFHDARAEIIAGRRRWPGSTAKLIAEVQYEVVVDFAPPTPWPMCEASE